MAYGILLVTIDSEAGAIALGETLVESRLAACVNYFPVQSIYQWQGNRCREPEWQLVIKTDLAHYTDLEAKIRQFHPYDLPEIIALPIAQGFPPYLEWIASQTGPTPPTP